MKATYLYIKQHPNGLKYFGKTEKNPHTYRGSGLYWRRYLSKYGGKGVVTLWTKLFTDEKELVEYAINFSEKNDIVNSDEWANLKFENGLDGGRDPGFTGWDPTAEQRAAISERMKNDNPMFNEEFRKKHKKAMRTDERRKLISELKKNNRNVRGKSWYNNGKITKMFTTPPDDSWTKGRLDPHWNTRRKKDGTD